MSVTGESVEAAFIALMGASLVLAAVRLRGQGALTWSTAVVLGAAGAAALVWKGSLAFGYSEDSTGWVELAETGFFLLFTSALLLWSSGLLARHARLLQEAARVRTQLVNVVGHDLAGPVTALKAQLFVLRRGVSPDDVRHVDAAASAVGRMERLVGDLRDLALADARKLRVETHPLDVGAVLEDVALGLRASFEAQGLRLVTQVPAGLRATGDAQRVAQVAANLLTNARKFTPAGGQVVLRAVAQPRGVRIAVVDEGRGLLPAEAARLFQPFSQVHAPAEAREGGTGLGLYICRSLVEAQGGRIGVQSDGLGKGCTFWFTLPPA